MKARNRQRFPVFSCCLVVAACTGAPDVAEPANEIAWVKKVMVHGVPIYATNTTGDDKLLHAAGVLAQFLDNDEDGEIDNPKMHQAMLDTAGTIVMTGTQDEAHEMDWANAPRGQGLYDEETEIDARARGVFDIALEEIWHMVSDNGYGVAYPDVFGTGPGTALTDAMDIARGGRFDGPPDEYPEGAWYTYDDETCDYGCMASEYIYWVYTSFIGAQDLPGRLDQIGHEWPLNTPEKLKEGEPVLFEILSDPEYRIPMVIPDGTYDGATLEIEPYEFPLPVRSGEPEDPPRQVRRRSPGDHDRARRGHVDPRDAGVDSRLVRHRRTRQRLRRLRVHGPGRRPDRAGRSRTALGRHPTRLGRDGLQVRRAERRLRHHSARGPRPGAGRRPVDGVRLPLRGAQGLRRRARPGSHRGQLQARAGPVADLPGRNRRPLAHRLPAALRGTRRDVREPAGLVRVADHGLHQPSGAERGRTAQADATRRAVAVRGGVGRDRAGCHQDRRDRTDDHAPHANRSVAARPQRGLGGRRRPGRRHRHEPEYRHVRLRAARRRDGAAARDPGALGRVPEGRRDPGGDDQGRPDAARDHRATTRPGSRRPGSSSATTSSTWCQPRTTSRRMPPASTPRRHTFPSTPTDRRRAPGPGRSRPTSAPGSAPWARTGRETSRSLPTTTSSSSTSSTCPRRPPRARTSTCSGGTTKRRW